LGLAADEGMAVIERVLSLKDVSRIVVSTGDLNDRINQWIKLESLRKGIENEAQSSYSSYFARPNLGTAYAAPKDETERLITESWRDVLGIDPIGVNDSFPELGGNSLQAIQIISRLRDVFQVDLSIRSLFDAPTIAELAPIIKGKILSEIVQMSEEDAKAMVVGIPEAKLG
jgi:acyl carrier protein